MAVLIQSLTEIPPDEKGNPVTQALVVATYHKGETLRKVKNTFMFTKGYSDLPLIVFIQDVLDYDKYKWITGEHVYFWHPDVVFQHLAQVRRYLQEKLTEQGYKWIVLMDDDLRFTFRPYLKSAPTLYEPLFDNECPSIQKSTAKNSRYTFTDMVLSMLEYLTEESPVVSIVQRFGSQNKVAPVTYNNRMLHIWMMHLPALSKKGVYFDDRYTTVSDFRFLFDVARAGLHTITLNKYVHDDYVSMTSKGGCNEYRNGPERIAIQNACVKQLASDYPDFCKAVWEEHSPYNQEGAWNPRIDWKSVGAYAVKRAEADTL